jgi:peptidoglycan/xylan/chitin deacetylase (PgdA/CDA1 family)
MIQIDSGINVNDWDWRHVSDAQIISRIMAQVKPGSIIQLHDGTNVLGRDRATPLSAGLLQELKQRGYAMVTLPSQGDPAIGGE